MKTSSEITEPATDRAGTARATAPEAVPETAAPQDAAPRDAGDGDAPQPRPRGWAWALPGGPACAREARAVLGQALGALGVPADLVADAQLMISELATNAYQHAPGQGPYELWLYPHGPHAGRERGRSRELRCGIFDGLPDASLPGYSWTSGDCGRGLSIVRELSGGRWGTDRDRSRFGDHPPGKVVWFALPPSAPCPSAPLDGRRDVGDEGQ